MIATVILAAGSARRMRGGDKLLEPVAGEPVLRRLARAARAAGGPVAVTLRVPDTDRARALDGLDATLLPVPDADEGMAASVRVAADWALGLGVDGLALCPGDLPELEPGDFAALAAVFDPSGPPLRACDAGGQAGHPVVFPARMLPDLRRVTGDRGARVVLAAHPPRLVPLPGRRATTDLDTPEAWAAWRSAQGRDCR